MSRLYRNAIGLSVNDILKPIRNRPLDIDAGEGNDGVVRVETLTQRKSTGFEHQETRDRRFLSARSKHSLNFRPATATWSRM